LHVVFGTGPLGLAVMRALGAGEKQVRMVNRSGRTEAPSDVEVVAADATDRAAARRACAGAAVVYHCAMAPYAQWPAKLPAIMAGIMEGAASAAPGWFTGTTSMRMGGSPDHSPKTCPTVRRRRTGECGPWWPRC